MAISRIKKSSMPEQTLDLIREHCASGKAPGLTALADAARAEHGDSVRAVIFYGSCLRSGDVHDGLADLYLLVDDYSSAFKSRTMATLNWLLPPNVFYLEIPFEGKTLRAKYAVLTLDDFQKGTTRWFHSYLWARFAQKCGVVYTQDETVARRVHEALAGSVMRFIECTLPQMKGTFSARELWSRGLSLTYRAELRTEQPDASVRLFDANPEYYEALTRQVLADAPYNDTVKIEPNSRYRLDITDQMRRYNTLSWGMRASQGKLLSILRLLKALLTFKGGVDYILWKVERHSGKRIEVGPGLRRFPHLAILVIFWRLYRQDAFR
jgi:hypothetical protein